MRLERQTFRDAVFTLQWMVSTEKEQIQFKEAVEEFFKIQLHTNEYFRLLAGMEAIHDEDEFKATASAR